MLDRIKKFFRIEAGQEETTISPDERASFKLQYGDVEIGTLTLKDGSWTFVYSEEFRAQADQQGGIRALADFPDVRRTYESDDLWPFFLARIPSMKQPAVERRVEERGIDRSNPAQLLREFGERSIANPFLLKSA